MGRKLRPAGTVVAVTGVMSLASGRDLRGAKTGWAARVVPGQNDGMTELNPGAVIEAVTKDVRLRPFVRDGEIVIMPARQSRRRLLLNEVARAFEPGVRYPERTVSLFLASFYADHAALRRYMVDEGFLSRADGEYWRSGGS